MAKYAAKGNVVFKWTISSTLTTVAQVRSVETDATTAPIDVTDLDDAAREFAASIVDNGEVTIEIVYDPANAQVVALRADHAAGTQRAAQITFVSATRAFTAFVTGFRESGAEGGALMATVTLKISGAVTDA